MTKVSLLLLATITMKIAAAEGGMGSARDLSLPAPPAKGPVSLEEALAHRHSVREFLPQAVTLAEVSLLAWAAQGANSPEGRTTPSAGATYPLEIYLVAGHVEGLAPGVYHYIPAGHRLQALSNVDVRASLAAAAVNQSWIGHAAMVAVIAAAYERTTVRYGKRGERYVHMEAGHAAQNLLLEAAALGLGAAPVGAFNDSDVARLLHLPDGVEPLYVIPVGRARRR